MAPTYTDPVLCVIAENGFVIQTRRKQVRHFCILDICQLIFKFFPFFKTSQKCSMTKKLKVIHIFSILFFEETFKNVTLPENNREVTSESLNWFYFIGNFNNHKNFGTTLISTRPYARCVKCVRRLSIMNGKFQSTPRRRANTRERGFSATFNDVRRAHFAWGTICADVH